tara:strand:+ start:15194 stop:15832 length:639 start_codon:yes stop_codon:yes gene_type:complete
MTTDYGDRNLGDSLTIFWQTVDRLGRPAPATSLVLAVYKDDDAGEETISITDDADGYDFLLGLTKKKIDLTAGSFYESGHDYTVVVKSGTLANESLEGYPIATFSIENRQGAFFGIRGKVVGDGTTVAPNSTTYFWTDLTLPADTNDYANQTVLWTSGNLKGLVYFIDSSGFSGNGSGGPPPPSTHNFTMQYAMAEVPANDDTFLVLGSKGD